MNDRCDGLVAYQVKSKSINVPFRSGSSILCFRILKPISDIYDNGKYESPNKLLGKFSDGTFFWKLRTENMNATSFINNC